MDAGLNTGIVLTDLQNAFDKVDHSRLAKRLTAMGVSERAVTWFESYLSGRQQFVAVNGGHSSYGSITCEVCQGSMLGPLL